MKKKGKLANVPSPKMKWKTTLYPRVIPFISGYAFTSLQKKAWNEDDGDDNKI